MTRLPSYFLTLIAGSAICLSSVAQTTTSSSEDRAFQTIRTSLSASSIARQRGLDSWSPSMGGRLSFSSPYHRGHFEMEIGWRNWEPGQDELPQFQALTTLAGWSIHSPSDFAIEIHSGILVGNVLMLLDLENADAGRIESEITAVPFVRFNRRITGSIRVFFDLRGARVFTNPRWEFVDTSFGISVEQTTPDWLKRILK